MLSHSSNKKETILKIIDFNTSTEIYNTLAGTLVGTIPYMAPEIGLNIQYNFKVDVW